ncbi:AMP-binding protein [Geodermatophilus sp. YIM 151500]|uniref:AMP-binding protein n=1 Tax=Geodermatophilus sp. YIM 151500 TaxID=2984531 RepID=UPI0021E400E9|nr:AMP-binding protein [Geodermatophilus sp. YIM 151500]MCV2488881.1 AMP-binding protein [Geodermatophilus sp. YIM 151500]
MPIEELERLTVTWSPPPGAFDASPAGRFAARHGIPGPGALVERALADPAWYWAAAVEDVGIPWMRPYGAVVDTARGVEHPEFFVGGRLNWADFAVDRWVREGRGSAPAIRWEGEDGATRALDYSELAEQVNRAAGALRGAGVGRGDVVALLLPMVPEAVVAVLAAARIGAIALPLFSGYGPQAVRARLEDAGARALVTCDAFPRRGRPVPLKRVADEAARGLAGLRTVLVVDRLGSGNPLVPGRDVDWAAALAAAEPVTAAEPMAGFDPCLLLYTSGSTGRPKGCVHTHAGLPLKIAIEARHGLGVDETSAVLWLTDMGWVMGSYVVAAALGNGGTAVLFEGVPDWPAPDRLWDVAERLRATVLGVSPTVVRALMAHGDGWPDRHALADLRAIGSTGEPWNVEPWLWCAEHVGKGRAPVVNISGGTEIGGSLLCGATWLPAKPTSFPGPPLGVRVDVVDESGRSVRGEVGELVVRSVWPGMTRGFWRDEERYLASYWRRFPGVWHHGDLAYVDADGFWYVLGRSDDTIKVAGKRLGPAEVESLLVADGRVVEAAAVGVPDEVKGEVLVCFVVLHPGVEPAAAAEALHAVVTAALGRALAPRAVHVVDALPKTRNGKVLRRVARASYLGVPPGDLSSLEDAGVLTRWPRSVVTRTG